MNKTIKKTAAPLLVSVLLFAMLLLPAAAFSMNEFDPNSGEDAVVVWENSDVPSDVYEYVSDYIAEGNDPDDITGIDPDTGEFIVSEPEEAEPETLIQPLDPGQCRPVDVCVEQEGDTLSDDDINRIESSIESFYSATGVQPYLIFTPVMPEAEDISVYPENRYAELFGDDGGHLLLFFCVSDENGKNYTDYHIGSEAGTVLSYNVCEFLLDSIDRSAVFGESYADTFCRAFDGCAEYALYGTDKSKNETGHTGGSSEFATLPEGYFDGLYPQNKHSEKYEAFSKAAGTVLAVGAFLVFLFCVILCIGLFSKKRRKEKIAAFNAAHSEKDPSKEPSDTNNK